MTLGRSAFQQPAKSDLVGAEITMVLFSIDLAPLGTESCPQRSCCSARPIDSVY